MDIKLIRDGHVYGLAAHQMRWVFFDQENSSMARNTVNPSSWIFFAISLWDKVNGSKVPGKNAIFSRVLVSTRPPNNW